MNIDSLIRIMQASVAPCVLISGIGLVLLSVANRLARPIDRIRLLCRELKGATQEEKPILREQIAILYKRCRLLQISTALATASIILVSAIILMLFSIFIFNVQLETLVELFFAGSIISLIVSLLFFILDIREALHSVKIEMDRYTI